MLFVSYNSKLVMSGASLSNPDYLIKMKDNRIQCIPKEKLSGGYAVNLYRPTYKDYSQAMKLYPSETRENPNGPGYTFEGATRLA
jgi:hypothetical protein